MTLPLPAWLTLAAMVADVATTYTGVKRGGFRELNPLLRDPRPSGVLVKSIVFHALAFAGMVKGVGSIAWPWWVPFGLFAAVVAWNARQLTQHN